MGVPRKRRILIIEDDRHIAEGLRLNLSLKGYDVMVAYDGSEGIKMWKAGKPDLIVLDIMLPRIDGLSVLRSIRLEDDALPILILSVKSEPEYRIKGLSFGVDDYLSKPFHLEEFLLRVERLLKRAKRSGGEESPSGGPQCYSFGGNTIDFTTRRAYCRKGEILLTEQEIEILKVFITHRGKILSRQELLEMGWGYTGHVSTRTVDNFVMRLRKCFEDNPHRPVFFRSIRSVGYLFDHGS